MADAKLLMLQLVNEWIKLDDTFNDYKELVEKEKGELEKAIWDLLEKNNYDQELEDLIPDPICWR